MVSLAATELGVIGQRQLNRPAELKRQRQPPQAVTRKVPTVRGLRPLAVEQVASAGQVTELAFTGRLWTKGSMYGGPISAPGA